MIDYDQEDMDSDEEDDFMSAEDGSEYSNSNSLS